MSETILRGSVGVNGGVKAGSGFTVSSGSNGIYTVIFNSSFSARPSVVVTQIHPDGDDFSKDGGNTCDNAVIIAIDKYKVKLKTGDGAGVAENRGFEFIAIGPQ